MMRSFFSFVSLALAGWLCAAGAASAASLIRDAEVEHTLRLMSAPILKSADIPPDSVRIFIVNDRSINAFVAGGLNMFIHTGLILNADRPEMLMGVIAHETGHIAGAHLSQLTAASEQASLGALVSYIIGAAAAIGGAGDAGGAIMSAGQNTMLRSLLSHYRGNEQQADQAGIRYMEANKLSPVGMLDMFELLRRNEKQHLGAVDPYLRTHPLTSERIATMRSAVSSSALKDAEPPADIIRWHGRMVAKLYAFLEQPEKALERYKIIPSQDKTKAEATHMGRAVAFFRKPDTAAALREVDALIALSPDGFAYDLKGQILFESGQIDGAIAAYEQASRLLPEQAIILTDLGRAYLAKEDKTLLPRALQVLERAVMRDDANHNTFRQLAVAYGRSGRMGESDLALAREAALSNQPEDALNYAKRARDALPVASPSRLLAEDVIREARRLIKAKNDSTLPF